MRRIVPISNPMHAALRRRGLIIAAAVLLALRRWLRRRSKVTPARRCWHRLHGRGVAGVPRRRALRGRGTRTLGRRARPTRSREGRGGSAPPARAESSPSALASLAPFDALGVVGRRSPRSRLTADDRRPSSERRRSSRRRSASPRSRMPDSRESADLRASAPPSGRRRRGSWLRSLITPGPHACPPPRRSARPWLALPDRRLSVDASLRRLDAGPLIILRGFRP